MDRLEELRQYRRLWSARRRAEAGGGDLMALAGFETRRPADAYDWHGLRRGGERERPVLLVQWTVAGSGAFTGADGREQPVPAGHLMAAAIPSEHRYRLLPGAAEWTFAWLMLRHPYAVERVARALGGSGAVLPIARVDPLRPALVATWSAVVEGRLDQDHDREDALVTLALGLARAAESGDGGSAEADRLRQQIRLAAEAGGAVSVADLARAEGSSRSAFSHRFSRLTGQTPAACLRDHRLAAVARDLRSTDHGLAELAQRHGFADATHLGKAFRRRYHLTPGAWRCLAGG